MQQTINKRTQGGAALLIFALIVTIGLLGAFFGKLNSTSQSAERGQISSASLAQAKEALIGYATTYRDTNPNQVFGFMPCPDTNGDGDAEATCGATDVSVIGRLPWKTLGLPPLRDGAGECLWYAVSGSVKNSPKAAVLNWDSLGQFIIQDASGTALASSAANERPLAIVLAANAPLGTQSRTTASTSECGLSNTAGDYFEGIGTFSTGSTTLKLANADSVRTLVNNDQGRWITNKEIFDRIKKRSDFKTDIDNLIDDLQNYLNNLATASLPAASAGNKGIDTVITNYTTANPSLSTQKSNVLTHWRDNLLYTKPTTTATVNSTTGCVAVLLFGGERTSSQSRSSAAEKLVTTNYLESANATLFPATGTYTGATNFVATATSADIVRCIIGIPVQISFASNFATFVATGVAVSTDTTTVPSTPTVSFDDSTSSSTGGCFWQPTLVTLAGKTLRAYYEFQLRTADTFALGSGNDNGNGFTFQMVRGDIGVPNICGTENTMGALRQDTTWGSFSFIVETDVYRNSSSSSNGNSGRDPAGNHTAIMTNGNLNHDATSGGTPGTACDGTSNGCLQSPRNMFEESPTPLSHKQRLEIKTGCNSSCTTCVPANHLAPNNYAQITVWVDCTDCNDVAANLDRVAKIPTIQRCTVLNSEMDSIYFGLTGGFRSGTGDQGVTFKNFNLRSD